MEEHRGDVRRHIFWTTYFIIQVRGKFEGVIKGGHVCKRASSIWIERTNDWSSGHEFYDWNGSHH